MFKASMLVSVFELATPPSISKRLFQALTEVGHKVYKNTTLTCTH